MIFTLLEKLFDQISVLIFLNLLKLSLRNFSNNCNNCFNFLEIIPGDVKRKIF